MLQEKLPIYSAQSVYKGMMDQHENMQVSYLTLSLLHCCLNMVLLNNWQIFHHFFFLCHTYSILGITYRLQDLLCLFLLLKTTIIIYTLFVIFGKIISLCIQLSHQKDVQGFIFFIKIIVCFRQYMYVLALCEISLCIPDLVIALQEGWSVTGRSARVQKKITSFDGKTLYLMTSLYMHLMYYKTCKGGRQFQHQ